MRQEDIARLNELRAKERLTEKEFAQMEFLERKAENDERIEQFRKNQREPYSSKRSRAVNLAWEFYKNPEINGKCYVAVGGLDSIVLYLFLRSIGIDVPAVSVSGLEDKSIQKVHNALGVNALKSATDAGGKPYSKVKVIRQFGWPVISKEVAGKISHLQHPTPDNATVRHAIITGETGAQGGYRTGSKMQLRKWILERFGGADSEGKALGYAEADFLVSDRCCYYLKEKPCDDYKVNECNHKDCPYRTEPITNADRIRLMSNEELATLINRIVVCHHLRNEGHCEKCPIYPARPCDTDGLLEWLKQPAEGE